MKSSDFEVGPYDMCPCQSGKKYKFCCAVAAKANRQGKFPIGTVALYGPDNKVTTKIAASVVMRANEDPEFMERWVATDVTTSPKVLGEIKAFFAKHGVKTVVMTDGNLGCPHEEGIDFKTGHDCPICHYWAGKQGTAAVDEGDPFLDKRAQNEDEDDDADDAFDGEGFADQGEDDDIEELDGESPFFSPEQQEESERMVAESLDRSDAIIEEAQGDFDAACEIYAAFLKENLKLPMKVRLVTPFDWEEPYVNDEEELDERYEKLKRKMPSMDDSYKLVRLDDRPADWSIYEGEIAGWVVRASDGKEFSMGLGNLEPDDEPGAPETPNAQVLNDYGIWISDVNLGWQEEEFQDDGDDDGEDEDDDGDDATGR
jgi:hypothetical protein